MEAKTESILLLHTKNASQPQRQTSSQSKGLGKIYQSNGHKNQVYEAILISNKIDFKLKAIKRDNEGHLILVIKKSPPRGNLNTEHLCPKHKGNLLYKENTTKV